jgi:phage host-nuclease inhibitor protein Gam
MRKSKMTNRTTIGNREELEQVFGEYAAAAIERDALKAELEESIRLTRAGYEAAFSRLDDTSKALLEDVEAWAAGHPEAFKDRKSMELLHGVIGFRTSTPRVALARGLDEAELAAKLREDGLELFVRTRLELDKQSIITNWNDAESPAEELLKALGISVKQSERFFAEVRREDGVGSGQ